MAKGRTNPAPQTEVLPGPRREPTPEDLAPPNAGLPGENPTPEEGGLIQQPPVPTETLGQSFEIDETAGLPPEIPPEPAPEVTHDPLKDTKAALTKVQQELAEQKALTQAVLFNREFSQSQPQVTGAEPAHMTSKMLPDEMPGVDPEWPAKYMSRQFENRDTRQQEREDRTEFERFTRENPDFTDYMDDMRLISNKNPGVYVGPRATFALYDRAKTGRQLKELQAKQAEFADRAVATGAQVARGTPQRTFVSPKAGGGGVPASGPQTPPDFGNWSTAKQKEWLVQHGLYRADL